MARSYGKRYDFENEEKNEEPVSEKQAAVDEETVENKSEKVAKKREPKGNKGKTTVLCNFRKSPSIDELNILATLPANTDITIFDNPGDFYKVKANGMTGYIKKDLCVID